MKQANEVVLTRWQYTKKPNDELIVQFSDIESGQLPEESVDYKAFTGKFKSLVGTSLFVQSAHFIDINFAIYDDFINLVRFHSVDFIRCIFANVARITHQLENVINSHNSWIFFVDCKIPPAYLPVLLKRENLRESHLKIWDHGYTFVDSIVEAKFSNFDTTKTAHIEFMRKVFASATSGHSSKEKYREVEIVGATFNKESLSDILNKWKAARFSEIYFNRFNLNVFHLGSWIEKNQIFINSVVLSKSIKLEKANPTNRTFHLLPTTVLYSKHTILSLSNSFKDLIFLDLRDYKETPQSGIVVIENLNRAAHLLQLVEIKISFNTTTLGLISQIWSLLSIIENIRIISLVMLHLDDRHYFVRRILNRMFSAGVERWIVQGFGVMIAVRDTWKKAISASEPGSTFKYRPQSIEAKRNKAFKKNK